MIYLQSEDQTTDRFEYVLPVDCYLNNSSSNQYCYNEFLNNFEILRVTAAILSSLVLQHLLITHAFWLNFLFDR